MAPIPPQVEVPRAGNTNVSNDSSFSFANVSEIDPNL
jgi:hypothetical protein